MKKGKKKYYVFVTGYGLCRFKPTKSYCTATDIKMRKGKAKLPKGIRTASGKKWMFLDYYFTIEEMFTSKEEAINSIKVKEKTGVSDPIKVNFETLESIKEREEFDKNTLINVAESVVSFLDDENQMILHSGMHSDEPNLCDRVIALKSALKPFRKLEFKCE